MRTLAGDFYTVAGATGLNPKLFPLIKLCRNYRGYVKERLNAGLPQLDPPKMVSLIVNGTLTYCFGTYVALT